MTATAQPGPRRPPTSLDRIAAQGWAGVRSFFSAIGAAAGAVGRLVSLKASRAAGRLVNSTSGGWWPTVRWFALVVVVLTFGPLVVRTLSALAGHLGLWTLLDVNAPSAHAWLTPENLALTFLAVLTLRWLIRARHRVVIEDFVDYTSEDAKAVSGLATLLVAELGRLRELYRQVNDQLSIPTSVGVTRHGGTGGATEAGAFLTVRADDMSDVLTSAVASEAKLSVGPLLIPVGTLFAVLGRLTRGPRVLGSVHKTEAGGGPMLTTQIVGRNSLINTWRIDAPDARAAATPDRAFLDPMVTELACRMFTDLTLRGSVRWRAIRSFTDYLGLYWESLRTPKNRARQLRRAEGKLMEAIAEDEEFDLAYYNLGVIYSQLAETERRAAAASDRIRRTSNPEQAHQARTRAALQAFGRALAVNPGRWDAVYAIAVHRYTELDLSPGGQPQPDGGVLDEATRAKLERVVDLCDRVIALDRRNSQAHDLKGMALLQLDDERGAMANHHQAVRLSWLRLCRAEYQEHADPPTRDSVLPGIQANAAAALHNLAEAQKKRALRAEDMGRSKRARWLFWRSDLLFHQAITLAPPTSLAATEFSRGVMREAWRQFGRAQNSYRAAANIDRENPIYWAHLARAQARCADEERDSELTKRAARSARWALDALAPVFRRSHETCPMPATLRLRDRTLTALADTYEALHDAQGTARIHRLRALDQTLARVRAPADLEALHNGHRSAWELEQIDLFLARAYGHENRWEEAETLYRSLLAREPHAISEQVLRSRLAKALRKQQDRAFEALGEAAQGLLRDPLSEAVRREVGKAHVALRQYEEAMDIWGHTLWLTPNDPFLYSKLGLCQWRIAHDHQNTEARNDALAAAYGYFDQATLLFGLENIRDRAWTVLWRGRVASERGDFDAAIPDLRAAAACPPTRLAGELLLAEAYRRTGAEWLSNKLLVSTLAHSRHALQDPEHKQVFVDHDWGDTLSLVEVRARAACALALSEISDLASPERLALIDEAIEATNTIPDPRSEARLLAHCLDAQGELLSRQDVPGAVRSVAKAGQLGPEPEIILHLLQLYERQALSEHDAGARAEVLREAQHALLRLKELEGRSELAYGPRGEEILRRLEQLPGAVPATKSNGS